MSHHKRNNRPFPALEGTKAPSKALFIKRWGTLLNLPDSGFPEFSEELFTRDAVDSLFRASQAGWHIYLLGNEDHVWSGQIDQETWTRFESELLEHLSKNGVPVTRSYACTDDPVNGVEDHRKESVYSLPNTGAMYHARQMESIDLSSSWVIGDESCELTAGWRAGCLTAGVINKGTTPSGPLETDTAFAATDLGSVLEALVSAVRAA
jgi:histidinol phosphatase-like enzyme